MRWLIAYDITTKTRADRARARQVRQLCSGHGDRIQKSVYCFFAEKAEIHQLLKDIEICLAQTDDKVVLLHLSSSQTNENALAYLMASKRWVI